MFVARNVSADHKDIIHDVSYDFYARRMATCSSDQRVKVWDLGEDGQWVCTASWKTHSGSVWRVTWAHPEFGQVIATCSFDRTAAIWEEIVGDMNTGEKSQSHWVKRTSLVDSRTSVADVKFAPKHLGLQLATCSSDGIVRIYEAPDVMNLSQWSLQHEISCRQSCSSLSWSPSRLYPPMIAVGCDDTNPATSKVIIYEFSENRRWVKAEALSTVTDGVHDVAFAPNLGRSYHMLAIASKSVRIITLKPSQRDALVPAQNPAPRFETRQVAHFVDDHNGTVWRVSWNITGTMLASTGGDGCVKLWKLLNVSSVVLGAQFTHTDIDFVGLDVLLTSQLKKRSFLQLLMRYQNSARQNRPDIANYVENWKLIAAIKGDGTGLVGDAGVASVGTASTQATVTGSAQSAVAANSSGTVGSAKFYKLGQVSQPDHVPWH